MTEDQDKLLVQLLDIEGGLTDWEVKFIEDLERTRNRLKEMFMITEKQWGKMQEIAGERL